MRLIVFGMGYLGATHAACMAELGHEVLGVESNANRLHMLVSGELPFFEPGLSELFHGHMQSGLLHVTSSYQEAAEWGDVFFIAVGTPQKKGENAADVSQIDAVVSELVPLLNRDAIILGKSTVPVGTAERLSVLANELSVGVNVEIAWNPEFLREGHAIEDTLNPDRLVLGVFPGGRAEATTRSVYESVIANGVPFICTDPPTAELVKVSANAFLATKISFINAIAEVCAAAGANVRDVAYAIGHDSRIGHSYLNAGLGFGGGCLPKDIRAFMARAGELGAAEALTFLREVDNVNMRRRSRMVERTRDVVGGSLIGSRVAILGSAFKPESDDVRDSPALNVAGQLQLQGASVTVYDPRAAENSRRLFPTLHYANSLVEAGDSADVVLVLTEWAEFISMEPSALASVVSAKVMIDGRLCLDQVKWEAAGWQYYI